MKLETDDVPTMSDKSLVPLIDEVLPYLRIMQKKHGVPVGIRTTATWCLADQDTEVRVEVTIGLPATGGVR
jgi:hypothetical protein